MLTMGQVERVIRASRDVVQSFNLATMVRLSFHDCVGNMRQEYTKRTIIHAFTRRLRWLHQQGGHLQQRAVQPCGRPGAGLHLQWIQKHPVKVGEKENMELLIGCPIHV